MTEEASFRYLAPTFAEDVRLRLSAELRERWSKVTSHTEAAADGPGIFWRVMVTPGFPHVWPAHDGVLVYYAFAEGFDGQIRDGVYVMSPWAIVSLPVSRPGDARLTLSEHGVRRLGIQGIRPITAEESTADDGGVEVERQLALLVQGQATGVDVAAIDRIGRFYRLWMHHNAVIAAAITPRHPEFVAWVG